VNVMVEVGGEVFGKVVGHAIKVFECFPKAGRLISDRFDANDRAGGPMNICREDDLPRFDGSCNAHGKEGNRI